MHPFVPCPSCVRHVRSNETICPFCKSALPSTLAARAVPAARVRLDRLAAFTFAASLALTACGGKTAEPIGGDSVGGGREAKKEQPARKDEPADKDKGEPDDDITPAPAPMYGMPPPDDGKDKGGSSSGDWGGGGPSYGGPPPPAYDAGVGGALYGMPPGG